LRFAPKSDREPLLGDFIEEYGLRANATSSSAALKWCVKQVLTSAPLLLRLRLARVAWMSTIGVALLAYVAVAIAELGVDWAISDWTAAGAFAYKPLGPIILFPIVVLIGYVAGLFRRGAPIVLGAMMLLVVTAMTSLTTEDMPHWYGIAFFVTGPAAALIGSALRSLRPAG
jgi:uncharacterized membrane protein AbrB (regulator of aidB expression)